MPYAAKAKIEHEFETNHLNIWVTFRHAMDQSVKPPLALWLLLADDVPVDVVDSAWQDAWTLLLTSDTIALYPDRVTLEYNGPNSNLQTTWGKDWEPWGPILSTDIGRPLTYIHRGDPAAWDFMLANFTIDNAWHELDLSGIVPAKAKAVHLIVYAHNSILGQAVQFRHTSQVNEVNRAFCKTIVANLSNWFDIVQALDADRKIDYKAPPGGWVHINVAVRGWWF